MNQIPRPRKFNIRNPEGWLNNLLSKLEVRTMDRWPDYSYYVINDVVYFIVRDVELIEYRELVSEVLSDVYEMKDTFDFVESRFIDYFKPSKEVKHMRYQKQLAHNFYSNILYANGYEIQGWR